MGIRLIDGNDYPYFEIRGFPEEFIDAENYLCSYDENNNIIRDNNGKPLVECMCGNVICGRFDPLKPFFTENGSFWTKIPQNYLQVQLKKIDWLKHVIDVILKDMISGTYTSTFRKT